MLAEATPAGTAIETAAAGIDVVTCALAGADDRTEAAVEFSIGMAIIATAMRTAASRVVNRCMMVPFVGWTCGTRQSR
jgi:hypothetical protein